MPIGDKIRIPLHGPHRRSSSGPILSHNYFQPNIAKAAVEVLEAAGFRVIVPKANLCCGRPLYDHGMLDRAQALLLQILDELSPEIEAGIPIVGLEPSCVAVFRDELVNLFPHDERAQALSRQTFLLSEFLETSAKNFPLPRLDRHALLHGHCHHKSLMKMTAEEAVLRRLGVDFHSPRPWLLWHGRLVRLRRGQIRHLGSHRRTRTSARCPPSPADWLIIADGFSCREQIAQCSPRHALHLAEVLQMALNGEATPASSPYPESSRSRQREAEVFQSMKRAGLGLAAMAAGGALLWRLSRRR